MRPVRWIHISDLHLREGTTWSQDVVLKALLEDLARSRGTGVLADFVLLTGDLTFSGKADEYNLVRAFLDAFIIASGVPKERLFCIPGNHDIERDRQTMSFHGARNYAQSQAQVDLLLSPGDNINTLLKREEQYREFQNSFFSDQPRQCTPDGLGYVSSLTIDDICIAIIGLDSAWLSEGGPSDHGKLLVGERQLINSINIARQFNPHIVIGMAHHPSQWLSEFDRRPIQDFIDDTCQFFHCGHLHAAEARTAGLNGSGCLALTAGATFETRQHQNNYSVVTLDLLLGVRAVRTVTYRPDTRAFSTGESREYPIEITAAGACRVGELADAIGVFEPSLSRFAHYLSAILLGKKTELPIPTQNGFAFGSYDALMSQGDCELKRRTIAFVTFKNLIRIFYLRIPLPTILTTHGNAIAEYGALLVDFCSTDAVLNARLDEFEADATRISMLEPQGLFSHTSALWAELASEGNWDLLKEQCERNLNAADPTVARLAKRMLALGLANSAEEVEKAAAIELYRSLIMEESPEVTDFGNLATLLIQADSLGEAKSVVLAGSDRFSKKATDYLVQIGLKVVEATGDREFRKVLESKLNPRGKSDG